VSGRKQHFIPQAVQRGFGAAAKGKKTQVYVFTKGKAPYLSATEGVAAQRDFYSSPSDVETLDDQITKYEGSLLAPAIAALRESEPGPIDSRAAAAVVVHLSIRSAFMRGTFSTAVTELLNHFAQALRSEDDTRSLFGVDSLNIESMTVKGVEEELQKVLPPNISEVERVFFTKLMHTRAREKFAQMHPSLAAVALDQFAALLDRLPEMVVSGHSKALQQGLVPPQRVECLKAMNWQIVSAPHEHHFILPDCLALGSKTADFQDLGPYALFGDDELNGVVMPVSATKVLVGCTGEPQLDPAQLNEGFARCCLEFFISSRDDATTRRTATLIGSSVAQYVGDVLNETFAPPRSSDAIRPDSKPAAKVLVKFEPAARKSGKAQAAVRNLLSAPQLEAGMAIVEYVVITDNVVQSMRQRGLQLNDLAAQSVMLGTCHVVELHTTVQCQLYLPGKLVDAVVRGTEASRGASGLIRHQAGRATYYAQLARQVPLEVFRRPMPLLQKVGLRAAQSFASHYFGARLSMLGELERSEVSATLAFWRQAAGACIQEIERARLHFIEHRDVNTALRHALTHAELFLTATASTCVALQGQSDRMVQGEEALADLAEAGLEDWLALFARDLERYFESRGSWSTDQELLMLASHIERVLWSFGIVLSDNGAESIMMNLLPDERLAQVRTALKV